jgi:hypothetical protein
MCRIVLTLSLLPLLADAVEKVVVEVLALI